MDFSWHGTMRPRDDLILNDSSNVKIAAEAPESTEIKISVLSV